MTKKEQFSFQSSSHSESRFSLSSRRRSLTLWLLLFLILFWIYLLIEFFTFQPPKHKGYIASKKVSGYALLRIQPPKAQIWIDGQKIDETLEGITLPKGQHEITVRAKYYKSTTKTFRIYPADATLVRIHLEPYPVKLIIQSHPPHLSLYLNERPVGKAPFSGMWKPGWLRIRVEGAPYIPNQRDVRVKAGQTNQFEIKAGGFIRRRKRDGAPMVWIPNHYFKRGSSPQEIKQALKLCQHFIKGQRCSPLWFTAEQPQRSIWLFDYWLDRFEVTVARYNQCVAAGHCTPSPYKRSNPQLPIVGISHHQAQRYCQWAKARLPTEAEWEAAARGPKNNIFPWGNSWHPQYANHGKFDPKHASAAFDKKDGYAFEAPVGSFPKGRSPYGIFDLAGNVAEWVQDCYHTSFYRDSGDRNPIHFLPDCHSFVIRGGSWLSPPWELRTTYRLALPPKSHSLNVGFRCARSRWPKLPLPSSQPDQP